MGFTDDLAERIVAFRLSDVSASAAAVARDIVVDTVGCMFAGHVEEGTRILRDFARAQGGGAATVVGSPGGAPPYMAAMQNGTAAAILDYDDGSWRLIGHPSGCILPAIFALGEERGISGEQAFEAYILGYETAITISKGTAPALYATGRHNTGTIGIFGAVAACARLLGLPKDKVRLALGIAASCSGALRAGHGTMTKGLHSGNAAAQGMMCAQLAVQGFTAQPDIFEHQHGFFRAFVNTGTCEPADVHAVWGRPWGFLEPDIGPGIKLIPSGTVSFCAAECAMHIAQTHRPDPARMKRVVWRTTAAATDVARYRVPDDRNQALYCIPWVVTMGLADGRVGLRQFDPDRIADPRLRALCARVEIEVHPELVKPDLADYAAGELRVEMDDGSVYTHMRRRPRAYPGGEPWTRAQIVEKFVENTSRCLPHRDGAAMAEAVYTLPEARNIADILRILRDDR